MEENKETGRKSLIVTRVPLARGETHPMVFARSLPGESWGRATGKQIPIFSEEGLTNH